MSSRLQRVLFSIERLNVSASHISPLGRIDARAQIVVLMVFLATMLSVRTVELSLLLLYCTFPVIICTAARQRVGQMMRTALCVVPFTLLIGVFNPIFDRTEMLRIGSVSISRGWITFTAIQLRGMAAAAAVIVTVRTTGIYRFCHALQRLGVPSLITTQLLMVYRYMTVLIAEALCICRARDARSFGRSSYPLGWWARMVAELLNRTLTRAERVHHAMLARGFTGQFPQPKNAVRWHTVDTFYTLACSAALVLLRVF